MSPGHLPYSRNKNDTISLHCFDVWTNKQQHIVTALKRGDLQPELVCMYSLGSSTVRSLYEEVPSGKNNVSFQSGSPNQSSGRAGDSRLGLAAPA